MLSIEYKLYYLVFEMYVFICMHACVCIYVYLLIILVC